MSATKEYIGLIDGDLLAYKASSAVQKDIYWGDGLYTCHAYLDDAIDQFEEIIGGIKDTLKTNHNVEMNDYSFVFSDPNDNFRKHLMTDYKNNRLDKRKPTCYYGLVDWIRNNYESVSKILRDKELLLVLCCKKNTAPLTKCLRTGSEINSDVKYLSAYDSYQLILRIADLEIKSA